MYYAHLPQRGLIALSGADAIDFLQGLVSNDARRLGAGEAVYAALLSPQGKYLHDFFLIPDDGRILIDCEKERMDDLVQRLSLYKLRSDVAISLLPAGEGVVAVWAAPEKLPQGEGFCAFYDPRVPAMGARLTGDIDAAMAWCEAQGFQHAGDIGYDIYRLQCGVPDGSRDMIVDKTLLLECWFEELHGVDFTKGCYIGQEVTARSKHRGQLKKYLYKVRSLSDELPNSGAPIRAADEVIGELRSCAGRAGLAIIRREGLEGYPPLFAGEVAIEVALPDWLKAKPVLPGATSLQ